MPPLPTTPLAAPSLVDLRAALTPAEHLAGFDALIDALAAALGTVETTVCVCSHRTTTSRSVPSVVVVLADRFVESWLEGPTVRTRWTVR